MKYPATYYSEYLHLDKVLGAQVPLSAKYDTEAHDETLFIIIHQAYELWFKQILHEVGSIYKIMDNNPIIPNTLSTVSLRLERVVKILHVLNEQLPIIETMSPLDFMDFRDFLVPASGFQSVQFRQVEIKLGLKQKFRLGVDVKFFNSRLNEEDKKKLIAMEEDATLLELLDQWLARMPFHEFEKFDFWEQYKTIVNNMLDEDEETVKSNETLSEFDLKVEIASLKATRENFKQLFDDELYDKFIADGQNRISRKAKLAAVFIRLFRDEPIFHVPNKILDSLIDVDEMLTLWRFKHSLMVHRMLGGKIGTGGSSGHEYLRRSADNNRVFVDLFNLSTFLIPKSLIPKLPEELKDVLGFKFRHDV